MAIRLVLELAAEIPWTWNVGRIRAGGGVLSTSPAEFGLVAIARDDEGEEGRTVWNVTDGVKVVSPPASDRVEEDTSVDDSWALRVEDLEEAIGPCTVVPTTLAGIGVTMALDDAGGVAIVEGMTGGTEVELVPPPIAFLGS